MKVLVADDDTTTRMILEHHLTVWGMEVVEADSGSQAMELLQAREAPRIAILDWMMPGFTGPEVCMHLLKNDNRPLTYTVLLTARTDTDDLVAALDSGAHAFLSKPVCVPVLRSHIEVGRRLVDDEDKLARYAAQMEALAEERARQLITSQRLARTDPLTGQPNRRGFLEEATREFRRSARYDRPLSVLALDIDHFKRVNDTWGHAVGDLALQRLAQACRSTLRNGDVFGRIGGEEFAILLPETCREDAVDAAERLRLVVQMLEVPVDHGMMRLTVSIGVAQIISSDPSFEAVLERADANLYEAKRSGRNKVVAPQAAPRLEARLPFWLDRRLRAGDDHREARFSGDVPAVAIA
jgi:two-component system chemotaxis response regulator CheY